MESGDEEEETQLLGGGGFSPEELAVAAAHFEKEMVCGWPARTDAYSNTSFIC